MFSYRCFVDLRIICKGGRSVTQVLTRIVWKMWVKLNAHFGNPEKIWPVLREETRYACALDVVPCVPELTAGLPLLTGSTNGLMGLMEVVLILQLLGLEWSTVTWRDTASSQALTNVSKSEFLPCVSYVSQTNSPYKKKSHEPRSAFQWLLRGLSHSPNMVVTRLGMLSNKSFT